MAQDTTPAMVIYTGVYDSETQTYQTSFQAPFDKGSYGEIKVAFVRRGLTDYTYDPDTYTTEVIDDRVWIHWTGDDITTNDIICIVRETQDSQPYTYPNNQKHIEKALDNLSRQIQEVAKKAQNALLVDPSWMPVAEGGSNDPNKMDPVAWLQTIVRSKGKTLRELRVEDGYAMYTSDDPESSEKTWEVLAGVKTDNAGVISHIREHSETVNDTTINYLQYSTDGGSSWHDVEGTFAGIIGSPYDNVALEAALDAKQDTITDLSTIRSNASTAVQPSDLATVATSGSYNDLSNKPTIPAAQVNSDWDANSGVSQILNKPTLGTAAAAATTDFATAAQGAKADTAVQPGDLATVATSGSYNDLSSKPTIPTVNNATLTITQDGVSKGTFTANASSDVTIALEAGALPSQTGHSGEFLTTNGSSSSWATVPTATQSDWNQSDTTAVDYIKNKPTIPSGADYVAKTGDTMTGALMFTNGNHAQDSGMFHSDNSPGLRLGTSERHIMFDIAQTGGIYPAGNNLMNLGLSTNKWRRVSATNLNNGYDIAIPVTAQADTLALKSQVDLAANSGRMITDEGVWYAKMDAQGTIPSSAEVEGRNYADFTQTDQDSNPIIVIYTYTSGAWVQTETITPPASYDGYVPVTSKIWDIPEQTGQQGGRILWNYQSKDFTPYPLIISTDNMNITNSAFQGSATLSGTSTVTMPVLSSGSQIVNKDYVDNTISGISAPKSIDVVLNKTNTLTLTNEEDLSGTASANNFVYLPGLIGFGGDFEVVMCFTTATDFNGGGTILGCTEFGVTDRISCNIDTTTKQLKLTPGGSTTLAGLTALAADTKYYVKITRSSNAYAVYLSTDGITYTTEITVTSSASIGEHGYCSNLFGANGSTAPTTLHLGECYIKLGGVKIWNGSDAPGLHQRVAKGHEVIAFQAPTAQNNYTWYRKYADGWVEQGGVFTNAAPTEQFNSIALAVTMSDANYFVSTTCVSAYTSAAGTSHAYAMEKGAVINNLSTTAFEVFTQEASSGTKVLWEVKGMAQG